MHKPIIGSLLSLGITVGGMTAGPAVQARNYAVNSITKQRSAIYLEVKVKPGDTLWSLAKKYGTTAKSLADINRIGNPKRLAVGKVLKVPDSRKNSRQVAQPAVSRSRDTGAVTRWAAVRPENQLPDYGLQELAAPVSTGRLTSGYGYRWGRMHWGMDVACPMGTPVFAVAAGRVTFAGWRSGYGWVIEIDHGGFRSRYAHNSKILVQVGQQIIQGEQIAVVGHTGRATGNHLHLEIERDGKRINPSKYLEF